MRKNAQNTRKNEENYFQNFTDYLKENFNRKQLENIGKETGFIQRSSKINAFNFLTCLLFNEQEQKNTSLLNLKLDFLNKLGCNISRVGIHKRFNPSAVRFMKKVLGKHITQRFVLEDDLSSKFNSISIKDSTKFIIPNILKDDYPGFNGVIKNNALMSLQYEFDLLAGNWKRFDITKGTRNDQQDSKETLDNIQKDDLLLRDLGYVTMTYIKGVIQREAYYLNRLPHSFYVYYKNEREEIKQIDWMKIDRKMQQNELKYMDIHVLLGKRELLPSRLIIQPVPEEVYKKRIKQAKEKAKRSGYQISKIYKVKAKYTMFITNAPKNLMSTSQIANTYKLRWQIELVFKTWKSNIKIHVTKKVKKERFECQLIAKIIWVILNWRLYQIANQLIKKEDKEKGCSIIKFFKQAVKFSTSLEILIIQNNSNPKNWLQTVFKPLIPCLSIEQKKGKRTHCQILAELLLE